MARTTYRKGGSDKVEIDWTQTLSEMLDPAFPAHTGTTYSKFKSGSNGRGYSPLNQLWLALQAMKTPGIEYPPAPYGTWIDHGRQVKKGSKGKSVLKPIFAYKEDEKTGKKVQIGPVGFTVINTAFFYSDTEPLDEEKNAKTLGAKKSKGLELDLTPMPEDWTLERTLEVLKIEKVAYELVDGNTQGYSFERKYALNPVASYPMKTTLHELGHIVLGHTSKDNQEAYREHRGIQEFQAEAVAYLVSHELGLEDWNPSESRAYVRTWLQGGEVSEKVIRQVLGAVSKILAAGRPAEAKEEEGQVASAA